METEIPSYNLVCMKYPENLIDLEKIFQRLVGLSTQAHEHTHTTHTYAYTHTYTHTLSEFFSLTTSLSVLAYFSM